MGRAVAGLLAASLVLTACGAGPTSREATATSTSSEPAMEPSPVTAAPTSTAAVAPGSDPPPHLAAPTAVVSSATPSTMAPHPDARVLEVAASVASVTPPTTIVPTRVAAPSVDSPSTTAPAVALPPTALPPAATAAVVAAAWLPVDSVAADRFASDINQLRASAGLSPLNRSSELDSLAMGWAQTMAADGVLRHSTITHSLVAGAWTGAAENIGYGPNEIAVFNALVASLAHYTNMANPLYTDLGTAVVAAGDTIWTVHLFAG